MWQRSCLASYCSATQWSVPLLLATQTPWSVFHRSVTLWSTPNCSATPWSVPIWSDTDQPLKLLGHPLILCSAAHWSAPHLQTTWSANHCSLHHLTDTCSAIHCQDPHWSAFHWSVTWSVPQWSTTGSPVIGKLSLVSHPTPSFSLSVAATNCYSITFDSHSLISSIISLLKWNKL